MFFSGSKYEDNLDQVSEDGLSTAILNRSNLKHTQQPASTAATTTTSTTVRNFLEYKSSLIVK